MKRGRLPSSSEDSDDNGSKSCFVVLGAYQGLGQCKNMVFKYNALNSQGPLHIKQVRERQGPEKDI